jgi:serpin B
MDGLFTRLDGTTATTPMMSKDGDPINLGSVAGVASVGALPFSGEDLSFVVVLPASTLPVLEGGLTADALAAWLAAPEPTWPAANVTMPKFQVDSTVDLTTVLSALGVTDAFTPGVADFSGIDGGSDLWVDKMRHEATVIVDEAGATADAVSAGGVDNEESVPIPPVFDADSPFLFVILDNVTGAVLFMGRLEDPSLPAA